MPKLATLLFGLCTFCSIPVAVSSEAGKAELLRELMDRTGLTVQIRQFPALMKSGVEMAIRDAGGDDRASVAIAEIVEHEIEPERVIGDVGAQLSKDLSAADLQALLEWLNSPLGRKIKRLETAATSFPLEPRSAPATGADNDSSVGRDRERLYSRLDQAIRATEATVEMTLNAQIAVASALVAAFDEPDSPSPAWVRERIEAQRFQLQGQVTHQVHASFVQTYQTLSIAELESYLRQASTPPNRRYTAAVVKALNQSLTASFKRVGTRMGTELLS